MNRLLSGLLFVVLFTTAFSQKSSFEPAFYSYDINNGLPSNETYSVFEDSKGYIWVATDEGVARYNGYDFEIYTTEDGLIDDVVFSFYEDSKGRIWFLSLNSFLCYWENNKIHSYQYNNLLKQFTKGISITSKEIYIEDNGDIHYNLFNFGLVSIIDGKLVERTRNQGEFYLENVKGRYFVSYKYSDYDTIVKDPKIKFHFNDNYSVDIVSFTGIRRCKVDNSNQLAIVKGRVYDIKSREKILKSKGLLEVNKIGNEYWLCTLNGLYRSKLAKGKLSIIDTLIKDKTVTNCIEDSQGNFWISTHTEGVKFLPNKFLYRLAFDGEISDDSFKSAIVFKNQILVSTQLDLYNLNTSSKINYRENYQNHKYKLPYEEFNEPFDQKSIVVEWANSSQYKNLKYLDSISYALYAFNSLITYDGVQLKIRKIKDQMEGCFLSSLNEGLIWNNRQCFLFDDNGLTKVEIPKYKNKQPFIKEIRLDKEGNRYIISSNLGLILTKGNKNIFINEKTNGLQDKLEGMCFLSNGMFLIYGAQGIEFGRVEAPDQLKSLTINNFTQLPDVNFVLEYKSAIYIATQKGLYKISLNEIEKLFHEEKSNVNWFSNINKEYIEDPNIPIEFPANTQLINIEIDILDFQKLKNKKYQFRIKGTDEWVDIDEPKIQLINPLGTIEIELRYELDDLSWSEPFDVAKIHILTIWYRSLWFIILSIVVISAIFVFALKRNQLKAIQKLEEQNQLLELEQQMQRARLNPHFVFNVLNSIHSFMLHENKEMAEKYLNRFSKLMREVLNQTKDGVTNLRSELSILDKYLELEQLRGKYNFLYSISYADNLDLELKIPSLMIQPFVENAVLHGEKEEVNSAIEINFERNDNILIVRITNEIDSSKEADILNAIKSSSSSNAIGIVQRRLEKYASILKEDKITLNVLFRNNKLQIELHLPIL